ncbi:MAG TPA: glycosyltransferase family 87 protein [Rhizomicrobium sp.]|jgi:hypothetical protein
MVTEAERTSGALANLRPDPRGLAIAATAGLALAYPVCLWMMFRSHDWILGPGGKPLITDFLVFWLAGQSALKGAAAAAYIPQSLHAIQVAVTGHAFAGQLPWRNSPLFFFIATPLALLPYYLAFLVWVAGTVAAYSVVVSRIAASRLALVVACATPAIFICSICGQNGPLSAALIGACLLCLERRPLLAGVLIGLLSYKPQFGLLIPIILVAGGYWRTLIAAAISCAAFTLISVFVFGADAFRAFLHYLPITSNEILVHGINGFNKIQTMYGLVRWAGFDNNIAWMMQTGLTCILAIALFWLWRRDVPFALKAAALSVATLLATPHLFMYDFPLVAVAFAFLYRQRAFDTIEFIGVGVANLCMGVFLFVPTPIGMISLFITLALIVRRIFQHEPALSAYFLTPQAA